MSEREPVTQPPESREPVEDGHRALPPNSALKGHIDYVDLAERVVQGITIDRFSRPTGSEARAFPHEDLPKDHRR